MALQKQMTWRRWSATAVLLCSMANLPPALAAEPPAGEAVLNFVGADIESVIKAVGHYANMTFIIDPRVKGTINLISEKPVNKSQAFGLLASALRLQGYTIVLGDGFSKVVPEADAKLQAGPIQAGRVSSGGDQIATQIFRLNYESAPNLVTVLRPLISPNNTINANPGNNSLVITDYADNLKRIGKIIAALDAPATGDLDVIPIRYAVASDIAAMVNRLLEPSAGAAGVDRTTLLADARTNSVIVRAPSSARAGLAQSLIAKLDQPTALPGNVHVVYLKNAEATKLAQTLRSVVSLDTSAPAAAPSSTSSSASSSAQSSTGGAAAPSAPASSSTSSAPQATGGSAGFIQADATTNTLIITASEPVYRNLRAVIDQLDTRRAQVYIESMIVEVNADKASEFGIQWASLSGDSTSNYRVGAADISTVAGTNGLSSLVGSKGLTIGAGLSVGVFRQINGQLGLGAIAHALQTDGDANVLSTPNLLTLDNEEAKIIVGQNVPFITGQYTTAASSSSTSGVVNPFQTVDRKDVGLSLRVRPQVSEGGTVKMAIYQEKSSVDQTTLSASAGITTNKSSIETNVLVDDGQIIVLGGMFEDTVNDSADKVPGLGDIPVIGNLFKYQTHQRSKKTLLVFLRPTILRTSQQSASVVADRYDYMRGIQLDSQPVKSNPESSPTTLAPLRDGRPLGGTLMQISPPAKDGAQGAIAPQPASTLK